MRIYVGNLPYDMTEGELQLEFSAYGEVKSVSILSDKISGRPKGFGFVEMASKSEGEAAIAGLNGTTLRERTVVVNEARPRTDSRSGGSYGDRRHSGHGGGRGGRGGRSGGGRQRRY
ncbi:MAG: RNA-binding protein [Chloroflexota bacterium]|nr:RNA-binding protein [Chloroflexota bacterium]